MNSANLTAPARKPGRKVARETSRSSVAALLLALFAGCGSLGEHRVQDGETLYAISFRYGWDYRDVAAWNGLRPPYTVYQGQMLRVLPPDGDSRRHIASGPAPPPTIAPSAPAVATQSPPAAAISRPPAAIQWRWPTAGSLLHGYSNSDAGLKGIDIGGRLGQPVQAAAAGRVVYAGSGLLNYGNLVIIKHDDNYLSAYGYNRQLRVQEGDEVRAGQTIADMGSKSDGEILLHFQIRYDGRPINPLLYLPKIRP